MHISEFDYGLPEGLIAQGPAPERDSSRLMALDRETGKTRHGVFSDLPRYLTPGDVLVINDTRVIPARLVGAKPTGGRVEALLLKEKGGGAYEALVRGRVSKGGPVNLAGLEAEIGEDLGGGKRIIKFKQAAGLREAVEAAGVMPLPPYIDQAARSDQEDRERYQTVYASKAGAVAAPTAGLHFTDSLLGRIRGMGVRVMPVTLHVGPGTFLPVREEVVERHVMEEEEYEVPVETAEAVDAALAEGRRVIAVGTTSARTLESAWDGGRIKPGPGGTRLFIYPGYSFKAVGALLTNFHLPKSTLIMLVCAFAGREKTLAAYAEAVDKKYRFYSYGDAMFIA
ncbi:MAG TPA: tRNA preQ1(34) S-adenosylmethionine ribosyltransferase-isomerase QueA [Nitrospirota bacterium]|nr:tRNA preQ1(34) S-adenosylmethionine ribosyltransferase-isomerase QueA [Nitrospirota bacterium]